MLLSRYVVVWMLSVSVMMLDTGVVSSQTFPNKPIRIVTGGVGGGSDLNARLIAQGISGPLGQSVIVENHASGSIPPQVVSKAMPDGYTLLTVGNSFWLTPFLRSKVAYDPVTDFAPISLVARSPIILVVHPSLPVKSVRDLIALAKSKPGALSYSTGSAGGINNLAAELFKAMTGVNMVRIPYTSGSVETADLLSGQVQLTFGGAASVMPHAQSRLRTVAVASLQPSALAPGLPTVASSGLPGYEAEIVSGIWAPAKTPESVVKRLNQEIVRVLNSAEAKERFLNLAVEAVPSSPEQFAAFMKSDMARWGKVIKDAGIKED